MSGHGLIPKMWFYYIALIFPLVLRVVLLNTGFIDWLWYQQHVEAYNFLSALRVQPLFLEFIGGWPLPIFIVTVLFYWQMEEHDDGIPLQFLLLPIAYVPFTIVGDILVTAEFHVSNLWIHPLIIIPIGYIYIFSWAIAIWVLDKLRLVMSS